MNLFTPAVRLSLGLVMLTLSILLIAEFIGLAPNEDLQHLNNRQRFTEAVAVQATWAVKSGNALSLQSLLSTLVSRNPEVLSAAFRLPDQTLLYQAGDHGKHWQPLDPDQSTPTHMQLSIYASGKRMGVMQISYTPIAAATAKHLDVPNFIALILFVAVSAFIGFWLFIRRALRHLDPSAMVPARVSNALNILTEGVFILDKKLRIVLINKSLSSTIGIDPRTLIGRDADSLPWESPSSKDATPVLPWQQASEDGESRVNVPLMLRLSNGDLRAFMVNAVPIPDDKGQSIGTMASFDDITELEEKSNRLKDTVTELENIQQQLSNQNKELEFLASRDPLTNCFNRRSLFEYLEIEYSKTQTSNKELSCIMVDIDHFKNINDSYGHSVGDQFIKLMADTLEEEVRSQDVVARYGGEEFCILLPGTPLEQANKVAERCRIQLAHKDCQQIQITASFGVSSTRLNPATGAELIQQADEALYASKDNGRNRVTDWEPNHSAENIENEDTRRDEAATQTNISTGVH